MKQYRFAPFIFIVLVVISVVSMFLVFTFLSWVFGQGIELSGESKGASAFFGAILSIFVNVWFFTHEDKQGLNKPKNTLRPILVYRTFTNCSPISDKAEVYHTVVCMNEWGNREEFYVRATDPNSAWDKVEEMNKTNILGIYSVKPDSE